MDARQYNTLLDALQDVPDPRHARGRRHPWRYLLAIIAGGLASNQQSAHAIAHWAQLQAVALHAALPGLRCIPSESTILRLLRQIDVVTLEHHIACFVARLPSSGPTLDNKCRPHPQRLRGQALDGKRLRTATAHGTFTHLVSVVQHGDGRTRAQVAMAAQQTEVTASQRLFQDQDLTGTITTMDAGLTHRGLAQQIRRQGGHYLMVVKQNHPQMRDEVALFFAFPRLPADAHERYDQYSSVRKAHGRLEVRTLECLTGCCAAWRWPAVAQVLRRTCERIVCKTGKRTVAVSYGITSLTADEARAVDLERLWRAHWTVENRKHYVRDVTLGEDRNHMRTGTAPQALAALRNGLIDLWRAHGWRNIADAVRTSSASVQQALRLIGALPITTMT